jgi:septum site-determining protein MinC
MAGETLQLPKIRVRGRSFMALVVAPEHPLVAWFEALDQQMREAADFFAGRPIVCDLAAARSFAAGREMALAALDGLAARQLRIVGVEGVEPGWLAGSRWAQAATNLHGREGRVDIRPVQPAAPQSAVQAAPAAPPPPSLLIDRPVRSGQTIGYEDGDIIVIGSVASGAEVVAGGSIHVYGALRGRAIAGLSAGSSARIFCRKLEAEMVAVDRVYRTAEHWGPSLHGRAVQVWSDRGALRLSAFD